jgi:hypothetical protein
LRGAAQIAAHHAKAGLWPATLLLAAALSPDDSDRWFGVSVGGGVAV